MKHTKTEDEYIWVHELQTRMARLEKEQQAQTQTEKLRLKELHWMHCPKCGQELASEKCDSVEIDVCPSCKEHGEFLPLVPAGSSRQPARFTPSGVKGGSAFVTSLLDVAVHLLLLMGGRALNRNKERTRL